MNADEDGAHRCSLLMPMPVENGNSDEDKVEDEYKRRHRVKVFNFNCVFSFKLRDQFVAELYLAG